MLDDPKILGAARATAARTLAEMDGMIGKHQEAPDRTAGKEEVALSRDELQQELDRLRAHCAARAAQDKG
jgi:hypothetical protein